jgi:hypothetical protein
VTWDVDASGAMLLVLLGAGVLAACWAWTRAGARTWTPITLVLLLASLAWSGAADLQLAGDAPRTLLVALAAALAVLGGGPVTAALFGIVDRESTGTAGTTESTGTTGGHGDSLAGAGELLRGGAWIGALERAAVVATLVAGWPEGTAVVLALKGLGRYPELRNAGTGAVAERFIIGTFTSVLWAAACAACVVLA